MAAGTSCSINVTFIPTASGTRTGTLSVTDNADASPQTVSLTGTGIAPAVSLAPTSLSFQPQLVGSTSAPQNVSLTNVGTYTVAPIQATALYDSTVAARGVAGKITVVPR